MSEPKQVIVMRKDLNMRRGKQIVQGSHASMKVFLDKGILKNEINDLGAGVYTLSDVLVIPFKKSERYMMDWIKGKFTKICVSVNSEEELLEIYNKAKENNIPCAMITDSGKTEFNGIPTNTCCAIGPDDADKIDKITGGLKLL